MNGHSSRKTRRAAGRVTPAKGARTEASPPAGKRERILDAAVKVFAAEGFYNAKVAQIAQEAGVADGTIYLYFKSKDDLLISLFEDRMEGINGNLRNALQAAATSADKLRAVVRLHLELVEQNRHMAEVICVELRQSSKFIKEYANPKFGEFLRLIAGAIADGQRTGELRADMDPPMVARAMFGALDELALAWLVRGKDRIDIPRAVEQMSTLFIEGLRKKEQAT
jgi:TetR/AcrR family transcriptional regulator, fatty acid metabolism regulator protein